jgi:hypothetical protein
MIRLAIKALAVCCGIGCLLGVSFGIGFAGTMFVLACT